MLPEAQVIHQMKGRFRVRIPAKRQNTGYFEQIRQRFAELPGIGTVETNYLTGSVLFLHDTSVEAIRNHAEQNRLFRIRFSTPEPVPLSKRVARQLSRVEAGVTRASGGAVDFPAAASIALAVAGGYQALKKNVWPASLTLFWYAAALLLNGKGEMGMPGGTKARPGTGGTAYIQ
jgi:Heavy metal associated domain 2